MKRQQCSACGKHRGIDRIFTISLGMGYGLVLPVVHLSNMRFCRECVQDEETVARVVGSRVTTLTSPFRGEP